MEVLLHHILEGGEVLLVLLSRGVVGVEGLLADEKTLYIVLLGLVVDVDPWGDLAEGVFLLSPGVSVGAEGVREGGVDAHTGLTSTEDSRVHLLGGGVLEALHRADEVGGGVEGVVAGKAVNLVEVLDEAVAVADLRVEDVGVVVALGDDVCHLSKPFL